MGRFFSLIVIFAILAIGGGYLWMRKSEEEARKALAEERGAARRTFADKARSAADEDDDASYVRAIQASIRSYDEELKKRVYKKRPEWRDPAAYKAEVELLFKEGQIKEAQHKSMLEGYELVRQAYDTIMAANWRPTLTAKGKGSTRLDIFEVQRTKDDEGRPMLEGRFFFWGVEDSATMSWGQLALRFWKKEMQTVKEGRKSVEKEVELVLGRAEGDAQPRIIIQAPHKYIADFPSYVSIGHIWLPLMPREATAVDIEYGYTAKVAGSAADSLLKWEKIPVPDAWKLKEGESWEADVIEATEDEIAGREGQEEAAP